jgi:hypothetical protein
MAPLRRAAELLASNPAFLAGVLLPLARTEGWDDSALGARLGCGETGLARVLLCRRPRPDPEGFRADVERVATRFGLEARRLTELVRLADVVVALGAGGETSASLLAAARDREPTPKEPEGS